MRTNPEDICRIVSEMDRMAGLGFEACPCSLGGLVAGLGHPAWEVKLAAVVGLGLRRGRAAVPHLLELLRWEHTQPIYGQKDSVGQDLPKEWTEEQRAAYARRWRLKSEICFALGNCGDASALDALILLCTDQKEDYNVRAAACKALGQLRDPRALPALRVAAGDWEFCTRARARWAIRQIEG